MERPSEQALADARNKGPRPAAGAPPPASAVGAVSSPAADSARSPAASSPAEASGEAAPAAPPPEWYVGIAGEPVGPIDRDYLKAQIDAGKVTAESLVWREEMTDWLALNTFEELRALLPPDAIGQVPPAAVSDPLALTRKKVTSAAGAESSQDQAAASGEPSSAPAAGAAAAAAASVSTKAGAAQGFDTPAPLSGGAVPPAGIRTPMAAEPSKVDSDPPPDSAKLAELAGIKVKKKRRRGGMHPMAWAFIAMAASFGGVAAYVLLAVSGPNGTGPQSSGTQAVVGPGAQPSGPGAAGSGAPDGVGTAIALAQVDVTVDGPGSQGGPSTNGSSKPTGSSGTTSSGKSNKPCNPDDPFCGQGGPDGPSTGSSGTGSDGSGRGLSPQQAQSVVNRNRHAVSRKCLGLVTGKGKTAKIFITIKIASSGAVSSVSAGGGKDFPGLASCVRTRVRNWRFPRSGASTTVQVSFNFISQ